MHLINTPYGEMHNVHWLQQASCVFYMPGTFERLGTYNLFCNKFCRKGQSIRVKSLFLEHYSLGRFYPSRSRKPNAQSSKSIKQQFKISATRGTVHAV
jgi:hypothetical protein